MLQTAGAGDTKPNYPSLSFLNAHNLGALGMDLIQFRVHPSVGMARIGPSQSWYFLGPEVPRFLQEQYPNLRHSPQPLKHPASGLLPAVKPDTDCYRDTNEDLMPQAARFRVYAYLYTPGDREPYQIFELTTALADIEWHVELANFKGVKTVGSGLEIDPNTPGSKAMSTRDATAPTICQSTSSPGLPTLGWLKLETNTSNKPNGRLHVIGNEGAVKGTAFSEFPPTLYEDDWQDPAADGPVLATVELKPAFTTKFAGYQYLSQGEKDPVDLPADRKVTALPAWVVVNVPDYVPDMGHFVSLWDLALSQAWRRTANPKPHQVTTPVDGQHNIETDADKVLPYAFYDYHTHIHPILCLFTDVQSASGQARSGTFKGVRFSQGVVATGTIQEDLEGTSAATTIVVGLKEACQLKVGALGEPFLLLLMVDPDIPLDPGNHEFVSCTHVAKDGKLSVVRAQEGTTRASWAKLIPYRASTRAAFQVLPKDLIGTVSITDTVLRVDVSAAFKMPVPTPAGETLRDGPFRIAFIKGTDVEWMLCTANPRTMAANSSGTFFCELTVTRGVDGTTARSWSGSDVDLQVFAPALGHKKLDARALMNTFAAGPGPGGRIRTSIQERLRKPGTVYERETFRKERDPAITQTAYPREFGRRHQHDTIDPPPSFATAVNIDPGGSLARFHDLFKSKRGKSCDGEPLTPEAPATHLPPALEGENTASAAFGTPMEEHVARLNDYYWIVSAADMPMLKEYALTHIQFAQFEIWANGKVEKGHNPRWAPLFKVIFDKTELESFFREDNHPHEAYIDRLLTRRPLYAPAFLDMGSMGRMLGGSFLPGIEVGREAGKPENWSLYRGGTKYFPDVRFHPQGSATVHRPGMLTKDLAVPWFADYIACDETFWPTSRPQIVTQQNGLAYSWLSRGQHASDEAKMRVYWTKLGFIRRKRNTDIFFEREALFDRP